MDEGAGERDTDMGTLLMLGFSTQHPTVSCGTERPHLPPLGPAGVTNPPLGWPIVTKPRFRPSVSTAKSRYFNNLRLPHQTHTPYHHILPKHLHRYVAEFAGAAQYPQLRHHRHDGGGGCGDDWQAADVPRPDRSEWIAFWRMLAAGVGFT